MIKHEVVDGLEEVKSQNVVYNICDECKSGKATAAPHKPQHHNYARDIGDLLHADLVGPVMPTSLGGSSYILVVLDDASAASWVAFLKQKSDCPALLKRIITSVKNRTKRMILGLRSDRGGEFINETLQEFFAENGINHEFTAPYSPQSNGKAERLNRTLRERARSLLSELEEINGTEYKNLWAEAVHTANYIRNRVLNKGTADHFGSKTPFEILFGRKPNIGNVRIFGTKVHVLRPPPQKGNKFDSKTWRGIHVGYSSGNAYRVFLPESKNIIISRDVTFAEELVTRDTGGRTEVSIELPSDNGTTSEENRDVSQSAPDKTSYPRMEASNNDEEGDNEDNLQENVSHSDTETINSNQIAEPRRSQRPKAKLPVRFHDSGSLALFTAMSQNDPLETFIPESHEEAMKSPWCDQWTEAMENEMSSIRDMQVYDIVDLPKGRKPIGSK